ncbi:MAG TPA: FAD-dependent oxidoreductase [Pyrinomonadaceae bacterium]|nr:FAD-dependent oxidoreductase [Pyrinomonadaceae bacterium]
MAEETFDVTIIGAGPGGYVAAVRAAQLGLKTAIIEKEKGARLGGTCGLRGCIPTKQLLMSAHLYEQTQHLKEFGINVGDVSFDFGGVQKRKENIVKKNSDGVSYLMKKHKIPVFNGFGKILGAGKVEVTKEDGSKETVNTKNIIIATGSVIKPFPGFEVDGEKVVDSDQILELQKVPKSLIVMGAGAVGVEFASVYSRFGAETTIVEFMPRLLPIEDEEVSKELERVFKKRGIKSQTNTKLEKLEKTANGVKATGTSNGKSVTLEAEMFWSRSVECLFCRAWVWKTRKSRSINAERSSLTSFAAPESLEFSPSATRSRLRGSRTSPQKKASWSSNRSQVKRPNRSICALSRTALTATRK